MTADFYPLQRKSVNLNGEALEEHWRNTGETLEKHWRNTEVSYKNLIYIWN
jgi:hypothetical protein